MSPVGRSAHALPRLFWIIDHCLGNTCSMKTLSAASKQAIAFPRLAVGSPMDNWAQSVPRLTWAAAQSTGDLIAPIIPVPKIELVIGSYFHFQSPLQSRSE